MRRYASLQKKSEREDMMADQEKYLSDKELGERYGIHRITARDWVKTLGFPPPVRLAPNTVRWRLSDVVAWEASRDTGIDPARYERMKNTAA